LTELNCSCYYFSPSICVINTFFPVPDAHSELLTLRRGGCHRENHHDTVWECRWDHHPNTHNTRDHFHPPPTASRTGATDAQWPDDHRDICRLALDRIEERIETMWGQS